MNQILITEKLYITPELKRKKRMYKINFVVSIILLIMLFSVYAYAEYDRNKNEDISQDILASMNIEEDTTTIKKDDDILVIALDGGEENVDIPITEEDNNNDNNTYEKINTSLAGEYVAADGKKYKMVGKINIPSINVDYPILNETSDSLLKVSVCKFWGCSPNEVGNLCIAGHNYRNKRFFSKVPTLVVGDSIDITDLSGRTLNYIVYDKYTVDPSDVSCTSQLTNGRKILTLITCTNDSKQRVIVKAESK